MKEQNNLRDKAITVLELTKGFTPEQRKEMGNLLTTMEELAGDVMILEAERSELRKENEFLKEERKKVSETLEAYWVTDGDSHTACEIIQSLLDKLNSLKTK